MESIFFYGGFMTGMLTIAMLLQASAALPPPADPVPLPSIRATPAGDPGTWVTTRDYPSLAMREHIEGIVGFVVAIDPNGNPSGCGIANTSNTSILDFTTCKLIMARAHFIPARDAQGRRVADIYKSRVKWVLPEGAVPQPMENPGAITFSYIVQPDGRHSDCRFERVEGKDNAKMQVGTTDCHDARSIHGFVDEQGRPQRRKVTISQTITVDPIP